MRRREDAVEEGEGGVLWWVSNGEFRGEDKWTNEVKNDAMG